MRRFAASMGLGLSLAFTASAAAKTFTVTTEADSSDGACTATLCSLRDAVVAADKVGGSSAITLPAGEYKLTIPPSCNSSGGCDADDPAHGDLDIKAGASVSISGAGAGNTIINANHLDRALAVQKGASLSLSGATVENGAPTNYSTNTVRFGSGGGAIYSDGALTLNADVFTANGGSGLTYGGAVFVDQDATLLKVNASTFFDNDTALGGGGGAISLDPESHPGTASQSVTDSDFFDNGNQDFSDGGAIELNAGTLTISRSTFLGNTGYGGGAVSEGWDTNQGGPPAPILHVIESTLSQNHGDIGGAVAVEFGSISVSRSTIASNVADINGGTSGGGIWIFNAPTVSLINSTVAGNTAPEGAGLFYEHPGPTQTLLNDTIAENSGGGGGGIAGIGNLNPSSTFRNTLLAFNGAGGDCDAPVSASEDLGHNLDNDSSCFGSSGGQGDVLGKNPVLFPLGYHGGPTQTIPLRPGSPGLDAGSAKNTCPKTDQRGMPRPDRGETVCDIGAFEFQDPLLTVALTGSGHGSVSGPGISCRKTCSKTFDRGTKVTLIAAPAAGSRFAGWGGACRGTGKCTVTMSASRRVTARFVPHG